MKSIRSVRIAALVVAATLLAVAASVSSAAPKKTVSISVASLIPGSTPEAFANFNARVKQFEKANPNIKVTGKTYQWVGNTFAAQLAAGTLPMVFTVPFTDARTLGDNKQLADLTALAKKLPYFSKFNPPVIAEGTASNGKIIALPTAAYAQALHYNRALFTQAGLDPNKPPTTWAELRADAKKITDKTGKPGYVEMAASDNTAGWILTTLVTALGGRMESANGRTATLDNPYTVNALNTLKKMRWTDNSMGANFNLSWASINQAFAAGNVGMFINGSDIYTFLVQAANVDPNIYGIATIPVAKSPTAAVMGGGTLASVRPDVKGDQLAACVKWIDFFYEQPLVNKQQAIANAKTLVANKQPVGVPTFPVFNKKQFDLANTWIKPYFNVPRSQMTPFLTGIFKVKLAAEPPKATQSVYHALDPVVQAVMTDKNADIVDLLQTANDAAQKAIDSGT